MLPVVPKRTLRGRPELSGEALCGIGKRVRAASHTCFASMAVPKVLVLQPARCKRVRAAMAALPTMVGTQAVGAAGAGSYSTAALPTSNWLQPTATAPLPTTTLGTAVVSALPTTVPQTAMPTYAMPLPTVQLAPTAVAVPKFGSRRPSVTRAPPPDSAAVTMPTESFRHMRPSQFAAEDPEDTESLDEATVQTRSRKHLPENAPRRRHACCC